MLEIIVSYQDQSGLRCGLDGCAVSCLIPVVSDDAKSNSLLPIDCWSGTMRGVYYDQLPHWVVDRGCYSLMFRCRGSLPDAVLLRLSEIHESQQRIVTCDEQALQQQRRSFKILEAYLDQSQGFAPFHDDAVRRAFHDYLQEYDVARLRFQHWVIMPNHLHLLTAPLDCENIESFKSAMTQFKLRSTQMLNRELERRGSLWQAHQYDRWVRNEPEYRRWQEYFRGNPVKAGLCQQPECWVGLK
jgi:putative transposase